MIKDLVWSNYTDFGCRAYAIGNYVLAEKMLEAALAEAQKFNSDDTRVATSFNNLVMVYQKQKHCHKTASLYKHALYAYEQTRGASKRMLAHTLKRIADLCFNLGDLTRARAIYKKVLSVFEQIYGLEHLELISCLQRLGFIYVKRGRDIEALQFYNRARAIKFALAGENLVVNQVVPSTMSMALNLCCNR